MDLTALSFGQRKTSLHIYISLTRECQSQRGYERVLHLLFLIPSRDLGGL